MGAFASPCFSDACVLPVCVGEGWEDQETECTFSDSIPSIPLLCNLLFVPSSLLGPFVIDHL